MRFSLFSTLLLYVISSHALAETKGYLTNAELSALHIEQSIPVTPVAGSDTDNNDVAYFFDSRLLLQTPRGLEAAQDDVYLPADVFKRFAPFLPLKPNTEITQIPHLASLMEKTYADIEKWVAPIKRKVVDGGKVRPFVRFKNKPTCLEPIDLVAGHKENDYKYGLPESGSYPSTHAAIGELWGEILVELAPANAETLMAKGIAFGDSRAICGFHYQSDLVAGRLATKKLLQTLKKNPQFKEDLTLASIELQQQLMK